MEKVSSGANPGAQMSWKTTCSGATPGGQMSWKNILRSDSWRSNAMEIISAGLKFWSSNVMDKDRLWSDFWRSNVMEIVSAGRHSGAQMSW